MIEFTKNNNFSLFVLACERMTDKHIFKQINIGKLVNIHQPIQYMFKYIDSGESLKPTKICKTAYREHAWKSTYMKTGQQMHSMHTGRKKSNKEAFAHTERTRERNKQRKTEWKSAHIQRRHRQETINICISTCAVHHIHFVIKLMAWHLSFVQASVLLPSSLFLFLSSTCSAYSALYADW